VRANKQLRGSANLTIKHAALGQSIPRIGAVIYDTCRSCSWNDPLSKKHFLARRVGRGAFRTLRKARRWPVDNLAGGLRIVFDPDLRLTIRFSSCSPGCLGGARLARSEFAPVDWSAWHRRFFFEQFLILGRQSVISTCEFPILRTNPCSARSANFLSSN